MKKVSVVIPMYYEEEVAQICYDRVSEVLEKLKKEYDYEIIFVNVLNSPFNTLNFPISLLI